MNIVQMHERVRFWTDTVGSPRWEAEDIDTALNTSQNDIVEEKYMATRIISKGDSFQKTQKIRDELSNLVNIKNFTGGEIANSVTTIMGSVTNTCVVAAAGYPANYRYQLALSVNVGSPTATRYNCIPTTYDRINVIKDNPFRRLRTSIFPKVYYIESTTGLSIYHLLSSTVSSSDLYYLAAPVQYRYGTEYDSAQHFTSFDIVIVVSATVVYKGTTYYRGNEITITAGNEHITSGTVLFNFTDSNINETLHEQIARKAAVNLLLSVKEFDKSKEVTAYFI